MIRLPKTYNTCGISLKIRRGEGFGGMFDADANHAFIEIGREAQEFDLIIALLHEMAESSACERGIRYDKVIGGKEYLFCCNHEQFSLWMQEVARGFYDTVNANRGKDA